MLKYNCIIIEDEPLAAEILVDYVAQVPFLDLKGICTDAIYAMEILQTEKVDLIFLDIHLPKLKGLDFLESLKTPPGVIITSAYKDYALQAFDVDVIDYLLKPIRFNRFLKAVNKVNQVQRVALPTAVSVVGVERKFMYFNVGKKKVKVYMDEILYVESFREYVKVITGDKSIITKCQLNEMEALLSKDEFLRIHRSFIVSKDKITAFTATDVEINAKPIPIGRSYKESVMSVLERGE